MTDYTALSNEELSAEIAKRLFGLEPCPVPETCRNSAFPCMAARPYASDYNATMGLVVPEMRKRGWKFVLSDFLETAEAGATFTRWAPWIQEVGIASQGEEPRAICEAALKALDA